jgi:hypothetical protein
MGEFLKGLHHSATADVFLDAGVRVGGTAIECMPGADHPAAVVGRDDRRDRHKAAVIIARIGWVHLNSRMAPIIVMRAMKLSSGPWWATSPISSRFPPHRALSILPPSMGMSAVTGRHRCDHSRILVQQKFSGDLANGKPPEG